MITSTKNPKVQWVRRLQSRPKQRLSDNVFVIEGVRLVEEAFDANWRIRQIFFSKTLSERGRNLISVLHDSGIDTDVVSSHVMQSMSDTKNSQGILAVLDMMVLHEPHQLDFVLILDNLRDPGNMGTILRTAAAANVQAVYLTTGCVDIYSPKVLRAGMGAHFRLPIQNLEWNQVLAQIQKADLKVYLASPEGEISYHQAEFQHPLAVIIGGEADGGSEEALKCAEVEITIPMPGGGDSLNAAVAAGIILFEIVHQREENQ